MIVVIFEFQPEPSLAARYFELASVLREEVEQIDGFISVDRFQSVNDGNRFVSISTWRDRQAVDRWREHLKHQAAQDEGKKTIFTSYRIRVAEVFKDYGDGCPTA